MNSILAALAYAQVFEYPLTLVEIWRWAIGYQMSVRSVFQILKKLVKQKKIIFHDGYYCFPKQKKNILLRKERNQFAQNKWKIAYKVAYFLKNLPTVQLIGVTGALAMNNTARRDDIDLIVVTQEHTMWLTRLLVLLIIDLFFHRRHPGDREVTNALCFNIFAVNKISELEFKPHDLYIAHELLHLKPIYDRDHVYQKMLKANKWVSELLPNRWREIYE